VSKSSYTHEEVQEILQALFLEKKKGRIDEELLQKNALEINRLKSELQCKAEEELEQFAGARQEISQLQEQMAKLKEMLKEAKAPPAIEKIPSELQEEHLRQKQRIDKLTALLLEREKKIADLQPFEYAFRKAQEQKQDTEASLEKQHSIINSLKQELADAHQHSDQLERVIHFLRERQEEIRLENNQFQEEFKQLREAVAELTEKYKASSHEKEQLEQLLQQEKVFRQEGIEEVKALHLQFESLKSTLSRNDQELDKYKAQLKESEKALDLLKAEKEVLQKTLEQAQLLQREKELLEESLKKVQASHEEVESRFKVAQQHLAKKVKENADLSQKLQDKEAYIPELQSALHQMQNKNAELQKALDVQSAQEKRLQDQLQEAFRSAESLVEKWEDKYFRIAEKWQESESRIRELTKLEERYNQLQSLLLNMGTVVGAPLVHPSEKPAIPPPVIRDLSDQKPDGKFESSDKSSPESGVYPTLFDKPKTHHRQKTSLFD
jgi:chromosome segregation ATPase